MSWEHLQSVQSKDEKALAWVDECLEAVRQRDGSIGSFLGTAEQCSRSLAEEVDRGRRTGPLAGLPIALKDNLLWTETEATAASKILKGYVPPYNATVVDRLLDAGAVPLGKTNMDEFAMGSSNENSAFGSVSNPWSLDRVPGGSSGGSAAAVAAGLVPAALGSDTGGSIRQPAALCGVYGLKPTYGRVSRYGLIAFASSLDQVGPMALDLRLLHELYIAISGADGRDQTLNRDAPAPHSFRNESLAGVRVGVTGALLESCQEPIRAAVGRAEKLLNKAGAETVPVSIPDPHQAISAYYILATAEASSNLARYDGVRYGHREPGNDLQSQYSRTREAGFGAEVKRRILLGTFALSAGYVDQYYGRAQAARHQIKSAFQHQAQTIDVWLMPTTPTTAFRIGEKTKDPVAMYQSDVFTVSANLAGLPAMNVPAGCDDDGLPLGIQLMAPWWREDSLFRTAQILDQSGFCSMDYPNG